MRAGVPIWRRLSQGRTPDLLLAGLGGAIALALYVRTLPPGVLRSDYAEFQYVGPALAIAHPPGYPLFTLLGWLVSRLLPLGEPAFEITFFDALLAAGAAVAVYGLAWEAVWGLPALAARIGALFAALAFALGALVWGQATTAGQRPLAFLLAAATCWVALRWLRTRRTGDLRLAAFIFGLGLAHHHLTQALLVPGLFLAGPFAWLGLLRRPRLLAGVLTLALLPSVTYLYLPLRSMTNPPFGPTDLTRPDRLASFVLASVSRPSLLEQGADPVLRALRYGTLLGAQFPFPTLALGALGIAWLLGRRPRAAVLLLVAGGVNAAFGLSSGFYLPDYVVPSFACAGVAAGAGVALALAAVGAWPIADESPRARSRRRAVQALVGASACAAVVVLQAPWGLAHLDRSGDVADESFAEAALAVAAPGATIVTDWEEQATLRYLQVVEGDRPDVEVESVRAAPFERRWLQAVESALREGPVYLTDPLPAVGERWGLMATGPLFRVETGAATPVPTPVPPPAQPSPRTGTSTGAIANFGGWIALVAGELEVAGAGAWRLDQPALDQPSSVSLGTAAPRLRLALTWRAQQRMNESYTVFVHLIDEVPRVRSQDDAVPFGGVFHTYKWPPGLPLTDWYDLPAVPLEPGRYWLEIGLYETDSLRRLPVLDASGAPRDTRFLWGPLEVAPPR